MSSRFAIFVARPLFQGSILVVLTLLFTALVPLQLLGSDQLNAPPEINQEEARDVVERAYLDILERYPDERGLYTYKRFLMDEGKSEEWLRQVLRDSAEGKQVSKRRQRQAYILYGVAALPLLFIGIAFYFRKSTKDFLLNSLLVIVSTGLACLALEISLRVMATYKDRRNEQSWAGIESPRPPPSNAAVFLRDIIQLSKHPGIIYELMPNLLVRFMGGTVTTDAGGFRTTPGSCDEQEPYTIIGLGDSVMFGWGVHDSETYLAYLAKSLDNDCVRIVNMAVPGYNTVMEVEVLKEKGLAYKPDLVIMHFVDNDLYLPNFIREKEKHIKLTRSYLLAALSRWQGSRIRTRPFDHLVRQPGEVPEEYAYMVGVDAYRNAMKQFRELSRENDFSILLLTNWDAPEYVRAMASELDIPILELGEPLLQYCREKGIAEFQGSVLTISKHDPHYSALAHRLVAGEVAGYLARDTFR